MELIAEGCDIPQFRSSKPSPPPRVLIDGNMLSKSMLPTGGGCCPGNMLLLLLFIIIPLPAVNVFDRLLEGVILPLPNTGV